MFMQESGGSWYGQIFNVQGRPQTETEAKQTEEIQELAFLRNAEDRSAVSSDSTLPQTKDCALCRRLKMSCEGPATGMSDWVCSNCKEAGNDNCQFNRISAHELELQRPLDQNCHLEAPLSFHLSYNPWPRLAYTEHMDYRAVDPPRQEGLRAKHNSIPTGAQDNDLCADYKTAESKNCESTWADTSGCVHADNSNEIATESSTPGTIEPVHPEEHQEEVPASDTTALVVAHSVGIEPIPSMEFHARANEATPLIWGLNDGDPKARMSLFKIAFWGCQCSCK